MKFKVLTYATALLSILLLILSLFVHCGKVSHGDDGTFVVAVDADMPGYASFEGEGFGYMYDILKAYGKDRGVNVKLLPAKSAAESRRMLKKGTAAAIPAMGTIDQTGVSVPLYNTSYVILTSARESLAIDVADNPMALLDALGDARVLISEGFRASRSYDALLDAIPEADLFVSSRDCFELVEELRDGEYDFLVCERTEANIGCALYAGVRKFYEFPEQVPVALLFAEESEQMREDFARWFSDYTADPAFAMLTELYFDEGKAIQLTHRVPHEDQPEDVISPYDRVMREICEREGYDWRLISAIAYSESRFKENVVSNRGAAGLMQIMPATARQFNVPQEDIFKPEVNIMLATKLLGRIEGMLKFPASVSFDNKMRIILACYNCGIGHVIDARRLASKYGANPNSWDDVALFLQRKANPQYSTDAVVKSGTFRGGNQTLAFVNGVMGRYGSYCAMVER